MRSIQLSKHEDPVEVAFETSKLVYLTADSDTTIGELDCNDVLIIGGLVDHNRFKVQYGQNELAAGVQLINYSTYRLKKQKNLVFVQPGYLLTRAFPTLCRAFQEC
mmetsp:Transcript_39142/g.100257  ORF Transcript_39142/g.100257 Transcript_39142/m.100257 type:complete len:106 (+) Transcript_39142:797-1114(+)